MQFHKIPAAFTLVLFFGCQEKPTRPADKLKADTVVNSTPSKASHMQTYILDKMKENSFVLSCGGGCAMTYDAKKIYGNESYITVKFAVIMFENEEQADEYFEDFTFHYNKAGELVKVTQEGKNDNFLETQMSAAQTSFRDFGNRLILQMHQKIAKTSQ